MGKRGRFIIAAAITIITLCCLLTACGKKPQQAEQTMGYVDPTPENDHPEVEILFLGDSIAEGVLGPSPVIERERYAYPSIVGTINGFTYRNRAVSGHKSYQMLEYISQEEDDTSLAPISHIKTADIISVSIIGNDLLQSYFNRQMRDAMDDYYEDVDEILESSYENLDGIVKRIRELNPDVTLVIQTVYNPIFSYADLMTDETKEYIYSKGYTAQDLHEQANRLMDRMNNVIRDYHEKHPEAFHLLEVNRRFDEVYAGVDLNLDRLIYSDCIHPSNEGHATIAVLLQEKLEELGLADHDYAFANYRTLCEGRLRSLYTDTTVNVEETIAAINAATTYEEINKAYFDATYNVTPQYEVYSAVKKTGEEEKYDTYRFTQLELWGKNISGLFDMESSGIEIQTQGGNEYTIRLRLSDLAISSVGLLLYGMGGELDVSAAELYIKEFFPTESLADLASLRARLKYDIGVTFEGIDPEDEEVKRIVESVQENKKLPANVVIPKQLALVLSGGYEKKTVKNETGADFESANLGTHNKNGETYLVFTFAEENGKKLVRIQNDVLKLYATAELEIGTEAE